MRLINAVENTNPLDVYMPLGNNLPFDVIFILTKCSFKQHFRRAKCDILCLLASHSIAYKLTTILDYSQIKTIVKTICLFISCMQSNRSRFVQFEIEIVSINTSGYFELCSVVRNSLNSFCIIRIVYIQKQPASKIIPMEGFLVLIVNRQ